MPHPHHDPGPGPTYFIMCNEKNILTVIVIVPLAMKPERERRDSDGVDPTQTEDGATRPIQQIELLCVCLIWDLSGYRGGLHGEGFGYPGQNFSARTQWNIYFRQVN